MKSLDLILLVEDDDLVNFYNEFLLKDQGFTKEIAITENGQEALDYLAKCDAGESGYKYPDLILLDINMPVMNGFEFMEKYEVREKERRAKALVVMLTTSMHPSDKARAEEFESIHDYLYKPLLSESLAPIIAENFMEG